MFSIDSAPLMFQDQEQDRTPPAGFCYKFQPETLADFARVPKGR